MTGIGNKTILVVEDNPRNMRLMVSLLEINNFNILQAISGKEAIQILYTGIPDLIILDIQLPEMDGFEIFRKIRENCNLDHTKIIAMTALAMRDEEMKIRNAGFDDYITKPIDTADVITRIKKLLSMS
ncbi:MAG: response regulator [Pseudomonadota bacterium]